MRTKTSAVSRPAFTRTGAAVRLFVREGPDRGSWLTLTGAPARIGTAGDAELSLSDEAVSRQHAEVRWDGSALDVIDRGSKNGTFVGGVRIRDAAVPLGAEIRLGGSTLVVVPEDEVLDPVAATDAQLGALVGASPFMRQLFTLVRQIAPTPVPVLVEGETGVGKHAIADAIHTLSNRSHATTFDAGDPATDLDVAFAEADGGTLLIDDVTALSSDLQLSLLRILDRKVVRPSDKRIDVRLIAISRDDLAEQISTGAFRDDLFYRLAVVRIAIPPLRDRPEDIAVLARHFAGPAAAPIDEAALAAQDWPGNARELRNAIVGAQIAAPHSPLPPVRIFRDAKGEAVDAFERRYLEDLMRRYTSLHAAADASGMDRKHLRTLLRRHGLRDERAD